jgi:hypothetical protein
MAPYQSYADRERARLGADAPDVYTYDELSRTLCVQLIHIWRRHIGDSSRSERGNHYGQHRPTTMWAAIYATFTETLGVLSLGKGNSEQEQCYHFLLDHSQPINDRLSLIEIVCRIMEADHFRAPQDRAEAIEHVNARFRQHRVGFEFANDRIVNISNQFVHAEIMIPALVLLSDPEFQGANDEFMNAHGHYRAGRFKEAIVDALKAFESTMKTIAKARTIEVEETPTASKLLDALLTAGLFPSELQTHFTGLRTALQSGLPTIRNKTAAHGQGEEIVSAPIFLAAHALHLAATNIVFLVECHKAKS